MDKIQDQWDVHDVINFVEITYDEIISKEYASKILEVMVKQYDANCGYNYSAIANAYRHLKNQKAQ